MFPASPDECPLTLSQTSYKCKAWFQGYDQAVTDAVSQGYLSGSSGSSLPLLTISEAQTLMPYILLVLVSAFGARIVIHLVKG